MNRVQAQVWDHLCLGLLKSRRHLGSETCRGCVGKLGVRVHVVVSICSIDSDFFERKSFCMLLKCPLF